MEFLFISFFIYYLKVGGEVFSSPMRPVVSVNASFDWGDVDFEFYLTFAVMPMSRVKGTSAGKVCNGKNKNPFYLYVKTVCKPASCPDPAVTFPSELLESSLRFQLFVKAVL